MQYNNFSENNHHSNFFIARGYFLRKMKRTICITPIGITPIEDILICSHEPAICLLTVLYKKATVSLGNIVPSFFAITKLTLFFQSTKFF